MNFDLETIREHIIGNCLLFETPFGERLILYADFTASGRCVKFIEDKLVNIMKSYANTHTEDDYSGKYMTKLLHEAEKKIKKYVNAGPEGKVIAIDSGTTGALKKLQEIIGVYIPPASKEILFHAVKRSGGDLKKMSTALAKNSPVVFIGPYEHHTNELMWREAFAEVVVIDMDEEGVLDLDDLEKQVSKTEFRNRKKIASISAGSNVTGIRTDVYEIARICHKYDTLVFFDFAAVAPYVELDMNKAKDTYFDAIFFSPHKFLGGPGSSGILVFNQRLYSTALPPTTAGGGTVVYVGPRSHDYAEDIEAREKAGTPPILQTVKAAFAMELKQKIGNEFIEDVERKHTHHFLGKIRGIDNVEFIGNADPEKCVSIISFNIRHRDRILHPKFVTKLLNDLFGIQSRAGCSCAGPYGHILLDLDQKTSQKYRQQVRKQREGLKPGWVRINVHYTFSEDELDFLVQAVEFIAAYGYRFLPLYSFNLNSGEWIYKGFQEKVVNLSLDNEFETKAIEPGMAMDLRAQYLKKARQLALELDLDKEIQYTEDEQEIEDLKYFYYV